MSNSSDKRDVQISKSLSYLLRHGAVKEKLNIDSNGYVPLNEILKHNRIKSQKTTLEDIKRIVENNDKKRFSIKEGQDGTLLICANQGHSISSVSADDALTPLSTLAEFPPVVIHGTYLKKLPLILKSGGLSKMNRNHIHFTYDESPNKVISGMRTSCNVLIYIDIEKCLKEGIKFYRSTNSVILSSGDASGLIRNELFLKIVDRKGNLVTQDSLNQKE